MKIFDYSFLRNMSVPVDFINLTNSIYSLREITRNKQEIYSDLFESLKRIAILQSVKSSNEIEGIITTDKRVKEIVEKDSAPLNHNEQEITGYRDALNIIHSNHMDMDLDENTILFLHKTLLSKTTEMDAGRYKKENNIIREILTDGTSKIRWYPVSADQTPKAMEQLIYAYMDAANDSSINQLLLIPCFILDFLCIHPFRDGNGRISRLLTLLLLYKANFDIAMYTSFEEQINNMKESYYESLRLSSIGWHENTNDYIPFMKNFIFTLYLCYKELDKRFLTLGTKKVSKKHRIEQTVLTSIIPISKKEIMNILPDVSVTTIEEVLSSMIKNGSIKRIGTTRNSRYLKNND